MEFDVDVCRLSQKFFQDYPEKKYPEIMRKEGRPYNCMLVDLHENYFVCIPFRSSILHKQAYMFSNSQRSVRSKSGLDYSKMVIVNKGEYIGGSAIVDQDEYGETMVNVQKIVSQAINYLDKYVKHIDGSQKMHEREFDRMYRYSTLKYFHDILGL